jgi:hypothetical protein
MDKLEMNIKGHVKIVDEDGTVLLDKDNAIHPQNMARVISRALSNESNANIYRIAFGNGGTSTDAAYTVTYKKSNDGQAPDPLTWNSRLYHETYSEIVDEGRLALNPLLGTDPGSAGADVGGTRAGGGDDHANDPTSIPHVSGPGVKSNELGLISEIVITSVMNPNEPAGQFTSDNQQGGQNTESVFMFDEMGLYTSGAPASDSQATADVNVGTKESKDDTGLLANTQYSFKISVDGGAATDIDFTTPAAGGSGAGAEILYGDLCQAINTGDATWNAGWAGNSPLPGGATISITDNSALFPSIQGNQTFGFLRFSSNTVGSTSSMLIEAGTIGTDLIVSLNAPTGGGLMAPSAGKDAGLQNDPVNPANERERLLSHLIFSPILKAKNRSLSITYTLTVSVARSV